ncbi:MAG: CrcB family protein [Hyphomonadaceae bacterium]|nr:CrcB family protein [Hyphomonadaceae bacterium]
MVTMALVALGGALGAVLRWGAGLGAAHAGWPGWSATLAVNALGGLAIGVLVARVPDPGHAARAFLGVGVLGGLTTFSTFSAETVAMLTRHDFALAGAYVVGSLTLALGACALGATLARGLG